MSIRILTIVVIALWLCGCSATMPKHPAVALLTQDYRSCGAVAIAPHELVTASHCVDEGARRTIRYIADVDWFSAVQREYSARVVHVESSRDLAWLKTERDAPPLPFVAIRAPVAFEHLYSIAPAHNWKRSSGWLDEQVAGFLLTTVSVQPGWSGSPVFGLDGKLVAIVSACHPTEDGLTGTGLLRRCKPRFSILSAFGSINDGTTPETMRPDGRSHNRAPEQAPRCQQGGVCRSVCGYSANLGSAAHSFPSVRCRRVRSG